MIVPAMAGVAIVVTLDEVLVSHRAPRPSIYIAVAFVTIVLATLDNYSPEIARPLAAVILVGVVLQRGGRLFRTLTFQRQGGRNR